MTASYTLMWRSGLYDLLQKLDWWIAMPRVWRHRLTTWIDGVEIVIDDSQNYADRFKFRDQWQKTVNVHFLLGHRICLFSDPCYRAYRISGLPIFSSEAPTRISPSELLERLKLKVPGNLILSILILFLEYLTFLAVTIVSRVLIVSEKMNVATIMSIYHRIAGKPRFVTTIYLWPCPCLQIGTGVAHLHLSLLTMVVSLI